MVAHGIGYSLAYPPFKYLGVQMFKGRPKIKHFKDVCDIIKVKLVTWKETLLSIMEKCILTNKLFTIC